MRDSPQPEVLSWVNDQPKGSLFVTAVTEAELRYGVEILPADRRRDWLLNEIEAMIAEDFEGRILPFDSHAARVYASIAATRRSIGHPISHDDCQIAAIARSKGASVATRDSRGFEDCGIDLLNPWNSD